MQWGAGATWPLADSVERHALFSPCGSELARDSVGSALLISTDTPPSRASSLPQEVSVSTYLIA
ncbi:hypothetical protein CVG87_04515 [Pseudomonas sp. WCS365]|nr:hypothetical protein CVG87_04515 [Pseudomonas sp. WCS365]